MRRMPPTPQFPVNVVVETAGDLEARFVVRIKELFESYRLIREILDKMPTGDLTVRMPRKVKEGETISRVEAPRGECVLFHQERRRRKAGARQSAHAQPVQLHVGHHHRAGASTGRHADAAGRDRSVLLVQRPVVMSEQ